MDVFLKDRDRETQMKATKKADMETAKRLIQKGKMTLDDISDCVPGLSMEELEQIEAEVMNLA
jgi:riboflavin synthase alpha subunit